jgi:hypothetical protein
VIFTPDSGSCGPQDAEGTGLLLPDPADLQAFGKKAVRLLLGDRAETARRGLAAHAYVRENYLGTST